MIAIVLKTDFCNFIAVRHSSLEYRETCTFYSADTFLAFQQTDTIDYMTVNVNIRMNTGSGRNVDVPWRLRCTVMGAVALLCHFNSF